MNEKRKKAAAKKEQSAGRPRPGQLAPDFEAPTDAGTAIRLSSLRGKRVVLYFYPKDATPG